MIDDNGNHCYFAEAISQVIGIQAAQRLAGWKEKESFYIPSEAKSSHPFCAVMGDGDIEEGFRALKKLCYAFGGSYIWAGKDEDFERMRRRRKLADQLKNGAPIENIAQEMGVSETVLRREKKWLETNGLITNKGCRHDT